MKVVFLILILITVFVVCLGCFVVGCLYGYRSGSVDYENFIADSGFLRKEEK